MIKSKLKDNALTLATLGGVICGIMLGLCLRQRSEEYNAREAMYVQFIGKLYISLFRMIILPMIIPSLIGKFVCNNNQIVTQPTFNLHSSGNWIFGCEKISIPRK